MKASWAAVGIGLALALQTVVLKGLIMRGVVVVDLVLIVVVYIGLTSGSVRGLLAGSVAGLIQDVLSTGIVGIGGLAKSLTGFLTGVIGTQFIVTQAVPRFVVIFGATILAETLVIGLNELLGTRSFNGPYAMVVGQGVANAFIGVVAIHLVELLPGVAERRRATRGFYVHRTWD